MGEGIKKAREAMLKIKQITQTELRQTKPGVYVLNLDACEKLSQAVEQLIEGQREAGEPIDDMVVGDIGGRTFVVGELPELVRNGNIDAIRWLSEVADDFE